jgi:hypothetical protein
MGDEFLRPLTAAGETYSIVGDDYGTKIGLSRNEDVWSVDPERQLPRRFINTSIAHFVLFLGLYEQFKSAKETRELCLSELRTQFDECDVFALSNEDSWWSLILEQIGLGLL